MSFIAGQTTDKRLRTQDPRGKRKRWGNQVSRKSGYRRPEEQEKKEGRQRMGWSKQEKLSSAG